MSLIFSYKGKKTLSNVFAWFLILTLVITLHPIVYANSYTVPNIMITEVTPDTYTSGSVSGQPDAFEFIELYNNTSAAISLQNYRIIYNNGSEQTWTITENKSIPAKGCFVLRTSTVTTTNTLFRSNFGVSSSTLPDTQISTITSDGMSNSNTRTISLRAPGTGTTNICQVSYDADNVFENVGISYLYPTNGTAVMRLLSTDTTTTAFPGTVFTGQVPPSAWDNTAPSAPSAVTATPSGTQVTLAWPSNSDSDLAFYRVYIDGTFYHTYRASCTSVVVSGLIEGKGYTFAVTAVDSSNNESTQTSLSTDTVPPLLITEASPDTYTSGSVSGQPDAFEFIELYNNTSSAINLQNYRIIYNNGSEQTWTISESKSIPAKGCFVLRTSTVTTTNTLFRSNFGVSSSTLPDTQISTITSDGMSNSNTRTISLRAPGTGTTNICQVSYDADNVFENVGISYLYPTNGTAVMRLLSTDTTTTASPGTVFAGQVPPSVWDNIAPSRPSAVSATPGAGQVTLSWPSNSDSDLAFYRVYIDGAFYHTYRASCTSVVVTGLTAEEDHTFTVYAVDTSNNQSAGRSVVSYAMAMALTAADYVTTPSGIYSDFFNISTAQAYIPGLAQDMIPQDLSYIPASSWPAYSSGVYVLTHYREDGNSSMLSFIDASNNAFIKSVVLYNSDGTAYNGHAGGVAVSAQNIWVGSDSYVRRIPISSVVAAGNRTKVYFADRFLTSSKASFLGYTSGILWSGEYYDGSSHLTDASHESTATDGTVQNAWITGYALDATTDVLPSGKYTNDTTAVTPDYILSAPRILQSICGLSDGRFVLSRSGGVSNDSKVLFYENVLANSPDSTRTVNGATVPLWFLDSNRLDSTIIAPPMSEGVIQKDAGSLTISFESGATEYNSTTTCPIDNLYLININGY